MRRWLAKLLNWVWPSGAERDLAREVDAHLAVIEDEYERRGLSREEARLAARRAFGGVEQAKERQREERSVMWLDEIRRDLRYAVRSLRRAPGFTVVAVLTLALGIGAAATIFSFADASILNPLPFAQSDRLVAIQEIVPLFSREPMSTIPAPDLIDYETQTHAFDAVGGWTPRAVELSGGHESEHIQAARITASLFSVLDVEPALGRAFTPEEDDRGSAVCVISDGLWRRWFGANPQILGRTVDLDRVPYKVIGVMPRGFEFPLRRSSSVQATEIWVPMSFTADERQARLDNYDYMGLARMKPRITVAQAGADVNAVARHIVSLLPPRANGRVTFSALVQPMAEQVSGPVRPLVLLLLGAVACLLLIACVNVANLLLARGATRAREFAVRAALGAGRGRLLRQLLLESLLLALVSAAAGSLLAWWGVGVLSTLMPTRFALLARASFNWQVLFFVVGITVVTAIAIGTVPGWAATGRLKVEAMKDRGASAADVPHRRLRASLVVTEVALSLVLLVGAGLLVRSFRDLLRTSPGFQPEGAVAALVTLPKAAYPDPVGERAFHRTLRDRLQALPLTEFAGLGSALPLSGPASQRVLTADGYSPPPNAALNIVSMTSISGAYLQAIGATLVRGRYFTPQDDEHSTPVAIVTQEVAQHFWPGDSPLGKRVKWGERDSPLPWMTVVGEVSDVKQDALDAPATPQVFVADAQLAATLPADYLARYLPMALRSRFVVVRGHGSTSALAAGLRDAVRQLDEQLAVARLEPLSDVVSSSAAPNRFNMLLMGAFAVMALLLAAIGVYGVIAYSVAQRTQEIGIRMALGADTAAVLEMVLGGGLRLTAIGIGLGVAGAALLAPLIRSLLYGIQPLDVPIFAAAAAVLLAIAAVASYVPARRAARLDPQTALRSE